MRKIAIRIDDVCPDMDRTALEKFERLLDEYSVKPLIGVVPFNHDRQLKSENCFKDEAEFASWLNSKKEAGWSIAMHGCYHTYTSKFGGMFPLNCFSEFAGIAYKRQKKMISRGKEKLKEYGINCDIFMAPAHSYDDNTLKALRSGGFKYVTDGFGLGPYMYKGLKFLPIAMFKKMELKAPAGITTFVVHTWEMSDSDLEEYEKLFKEQRERIVDYDVLLSAPAGKRNGLTMIPELLAANLKRMLGKFIK